MQKVKNNTIAAIEKIVHIFIVATPAIL